MLTPGPAEGVREVGGQPRGLALGDCAGPLHGAYDAALLDLDGVLYVGPEPVAYAATSVCAARAQGMRTAFVTNNASRRPAKVAAHLVELGISAVAADVVTSAQAAARLIVARLAVGSAVLVLGTADLAEELAAVGCRPVRTLDEAGGRVEAVVQGLSTDTAWRDLAEACVAIRGGALWVAGNTDSTYPSARGPLPGNGAMVAALEAATGHRPLVVGKPEPELHRASVERVGAVRPLVVGDRLDTDVLGAIRGGSDSLLVLTGVTDLDQLLDAPPGTRPTYVSADLRALSQPQLPVILHGDRAVCGAGGASYDQGRARPDGDTVEDLRAACALAWRSAGG